MSDETVSQNPWFQILDQNRNWLRAVVYAQVRDADAIDDVMQEVAMAIIKHGRKNSELPERLEPWLYRLAVLQSLQFRRKKGRERKLQQKYTEKISAEQSQFDPSLESDPLQWLLADEARQQIRKAIDVLEEADAEILLLKYTQNWSYKQLAKHLGRSEAAIESQLHRARKRLRKQLAAIDIETAEIASRTKEVN